MMFFLLLLKNLLLYSEDGGLLRTTVVVQSRRTVASAKNVVNFLVHTVYRRSPLLAITALSYQSISVCVLYNGEPFH